MDDFSLLFMMIPPVYSCFFGRFKNLGPKPVEYETVDMIVNEDAEGNVKIVLDLSECKMIWPKAA